MTTTETTMRIQRYRFLSFDGSDHAATAPVAEPVLQHTGDDVVDIATHTAEEIPPPPPPPPSFSEQELQQAKLTSYQDGFTAGKQEAESQAAKAAQAAAAAQQAVLELIANRISLAGEGHAQFLASQKGILLKAMLAIARKVAGDALKREPHASLEALLKECMGLIAGQDRIIITVAPAKCDSLRQSLDTIKPYLGDFSGEVVINADDALTEQDCRVEWKNGQAERNNEALWREIETLIQKTILTN